MKHPEPGTSTLDAAHLAGWLDLAGTAVAQVSPRIHRTHRQVSDLVFRPLLAVAVTQPVARKTRFLHHLICDLSYSAVTYSGIGLSRLARSRFSRTSSEARVE